MNRLELGGVQKGFSSSKNSDSGCTARIHYNRL